MKYLLSMRFPASAAGTTLDNLTPAYVHPEVALTWSTASADYSVQTGGGLRLTTYNHDDVTRHIRCTGLPALQSGWLRCWRNLVYMTAPLSGSNGDYLSNAVRNDGTNSKLCFLTSATHGYNRGMRDAVGAVVGSDVWSGYGMSGVGGVTGFTCILTGVVGASGCHITTTEGRTLGAGTGRAMHASFCSSTAKSQGVPVETPTPYMGHTDRSTDTTNEIWFETMDIWDIQNTSGF